MRTMIVLTLMLIMLFEESESGQTPYAYLSKVRMTGDIIRIKSINIITKERNYSMNLRETTRDIVASDVPLILDNQDSKILNTDLIQTYQNDEVDVPENINVHLSLFNRNIGGSIHVEQKIYDIIPKNISATDRMVELKLHVNKPMGIRASASYHNKRRTKNNLRSERSRKSFPIQDVKKQSYYLQLYIVADKHVYDQIGSVAKTKYFVINVLNRVNGYYRPFNIKIVLVGLEIWTNEQKIKDSNDSHSVLDDFNYYRVRNIHVKHDLAHLLTGLQFSDVLGIAFLHGVCSFEFGTGLTSIYYFNPVEISQTVVHELGHNFGIDHDTSFCSCEPRPSIECVMYPNASESSSIKWSNCSKETLLKNLNTVMSFCLLDKPKSNLDSSSKSKNNTTVIYRSCGNGIVDPDEQCDSGYMYDHCCNSTTCKFSGDAECSSGACCDRSTCKVKSAGVVCRGVSDANLCDFPEYCDGKSEFCPVDTYPADATKQCGDNNYCYNKRCGSRRDMCKLLYGESAIEAPDECYKLNTIERSSSQVECGYCSYNFEFTSLNYTYKVCDEKDYKCGTIHCAYTDHSEPESVFDNEFSYYNYYTASGSARYCSHTQFDMHLSHIRDPGLAPNGASCGDSMICVDSACVNIKSVKTKCLLCENGGECNNFGSCNCPRGYRGANCSMVCAHCCGGSEHANYCLINRHITTRQTLTTKYYTTSSWYPTSNEEKKTALPKIDNSKYNPGHVALFVLIPILILGLLVVLAYLARRHFCSGLSSPSQTDTERVVPTEIDNEAFAMT